MAQTTIRQKFFFGLAMVIAFGGLLHTFMTIPEPFLVGPTDGPAPLYVQIAGPGGYVRRANGNASPWFGCGIRVSWGDDVPPEPVEIGQPCASLLSHTYVAPGLYRIDASVGGFATVEGVTLANWKGVAVIQVR